MWTGHLLEPTVFLKPGINLIKIIMVLYAIMLSRCNQFPSMFSECCNIFFFCVLFCWWKVKQEENRNAEMTVRKKTLTVTVPNSHLFFGKLCIGLCKCIIIRASFRGLHGMSGVN